MPEEKFYAEQEVYTALMVMEWIEGEMEKYKDPLLEKKYPTLMAIHEAEGAYGMRRISIMVGTVIEQAYVMLTSNQREALVHTVFGGNYDFDVVPYFFKQWLLVMDTHEKLLEAVGEVSAKQMHGLMELELNKPLEGN